LSAGDSGARRDEGRGRAAHSPRADSVGEVGWVSLAAQGRLVLASASPRRARLLDLLGIRYTVDAPSFPETEDGGDPAQRAGRLAEGKARSVAASHRGALILGGDTEVVLDGRALGKPGCPREAHKMLLELRGRAHEVVTGLCLLDEPTGLIRSAVERTTVTMRDFTEAEAAYYAYSGDPMDKAGASGIQGQAAVLIERIEGCFYNVVGLPLSRLATLMEDMWRALGEKGR
jgi:septum formation protein